MGTSTRIRALRATALLITGVVCSISSAWIPVLLSLPRMNNTPSRTGFFGAWGGTHQYHVELYQYHCGVSIANIQVVNLASTGRKPNTIQESKSEALYYINHYIELPKWCTARSEPRWHIEEDYREFQIASGWPITAWTGRFVGTNMVDFGVHSHFRSRGALSVANINHYQAPVVLLPITPEFPGTLLSIAMYSIFAWFVADVPYPAVLNWKRRRRLAKGLCPKCKHELAGVSPCPECGTPIETEPPNPAANSAG
jgi:hypothetical protein